MNRLATNGKGHPLAARFTTHRQQLAAADDYDDAPTIFLAQADVHLLLAAPEAGHETLHARAALELFTPELAGRIRRLQVVAEYRSFASSCSINEFAQRLRGAVNAALGSAVALQVFVLGNGLAEVVDTEALDGGTSTAIDALIAGVVDLILEVRRRAGDYFERAPLTLAAQADGGICLLSADALAAFLAAQALPVGTYVLHALSMYTQRALLEAVAAAAGLVTREADGTAQADAVAELMMQEVEHACERYHLGADAEHAALASSGVQLNAITDNLDWRQRLAAVVQTRLARDRDAPAPRFIALPGLQRKQADEGRVRYLRCGSGGPVLLLVNAFGLTLDVWHDMARALSHRFTVLAIDDETPHEQRQGLPRTYYATPDSLQRFKYAVGAMLAAEGVASCHVASWCSGAKFAIELARAWPETIASLSLFSPSFAGVQGYAGSDSAYENNLHTMCKLVDRMPKSADTMAKSMMALMSKGGSAQASAPAAEAGSAAVFELADAVTLPWLHAPFTSASNMTEYSRQLLNFRAHQLSANPSGERLALPVMLVTGQMDHTTCSVRARDLCTSLCQVLQFELRCASHYFIHQNSGLIARLLCDFVHNGLQTESPHPRLSRIALETPGPVVSGEI